jgi:hypothetical protein
MKVLVVICLIAILTSYCTCVDDEKRLLADFDVHQLQLDLQHVKAKLSNVENEVGTLKQAILQMTSTGILIFYYHPHERTLYLLLCTICNCLNSQFLNNAIIIKSNVLLPQS